jgi:hypothetical protein
MPPISFWSLTSKRLRRYRYGTLIVFANYLIEIQEEKGPQVTFPEWLQEHTEITKLLERRSLD